MKQKQLIFIGLTVFMAILAIIVAILYLNPTPGDGKNHIRVRFQNIENITAGTRVTFAGKPVGSVKKILILEEGVTNRTPTDTAAIYPYELVLQIDSSIHVFPQDEIVIHTSGLMGEKAISIIPIPLKAAMPSPITPDTIFYGKDPSSMENTMETLSTVMHKADLTIDKVFSTIDTSQENITSAVTSLNQAATQLNSFMTTLTMEQVASKISALTTTATGCFENYATLAKTALHGNNTLSGLLANDSILHDMEKTVDKTNTLLDAVLEYGFFFHSNSNYKRAYIQDQNQPQDIQNIIDRARKTLLEAKKNLIDSSDPNEHDALIEYINNALLSLPSSQQIQKNSDKPRMP